MNRHLFLTNSIERFMLYLLFFISLFFASLCSANDQSNIGLHIKIVLNNGKKLSCDLIDVKQNEIKIKRTIFKNTVANEFYKFNDIKYIEFPKPPILTNELNLSRGSIRKTKANVKTAYEFYKQFAPLHGKTWAIETAQLYAKVLKNCKNYKSAIKIYNKILKSNAKQKIKNNAKIDKAVCLYNLGLVSNALPLFIQLSLTAKDSEQVAEINFYLGCIYSKLGNYKKSLFTLLKNSVFYSSQNNWELKSLNASLLPFAKLNRRKEFINTCTVITNKFPNTIFSKQATEYLKKINKVSLTNLFTEI